MKLFDLLQRLIMRAVTCSLVLQTRVVDLFPKAGDPSKCTYDKTNECLAQGFQIASWAIVH